MRLASQAPSCLAVLATVALAMLLPGCAATATAPATPRPAMRAVPAVARPALGTPAAPASPWAHLRTQVGNYPVEGADFLRTGLLAERLQGLLGRTNYAVLLENMRVSGPLRQDGAMLYITGNRPHEGGSEAAAVVIHTATDTVRVWLLTEGEEWDVQDQGTPKTLPADVATLMDNARR